MRLCTFKATGERKPSLGLMEGGTVVEVAGGRTVMDLLRGDVKGEARTGREFDAASVRLRAPVPSPGKIVAAIVNTRAMLGGDLKLDRPRLDMKAPSTVVGPGDAVIAPQAGIRPEVELAAVVGRRVSKAGVEEAKEGIFGYTILNDVTAPADSRGDAYEAYRRDQGTGEISRRTLRGPLFRSKNHDTFCPTGPWVVTSDELGDTGALEMKTSFEGFPVQAGSTSEYIFSPEEIASYVSGFLTLEPGDLVSCGSVGWTKEAMGRLDPTEYTLPREKGSMKLEVQGIGVLVNPVEWE